MLQILLPLLLLAGTAAAQPVCIQQREGMTACFSGKLCQCRYQRGGSMTGRPDGYAWDCSINRPSCDMPPADLSPQQPAPPIYVTPQYGFPAPQNFPSLPGGPNGPQPQPVPPQVAPGIRR